MRVQEFTMDPPTKSQTYAAPPQAQLPYAMPAPQYAMQQRIPLQQQPQFYPPPGGGYPAQALMQPYAPQPPYGTAQPYPIAQPVGAAPYPIAAPYGAIAPFSGGGEGVVFDAEAQAVHNHRIWSDTMSWRCGHYFGYGDTRVIVPNPDYSGCCGGPTLDRSLSPNRSCCRVSPCHRSTLNLAHPHTRKMILGVVVAVIVINIIRSEWPTVIVVVFYKVC